MARLLAQQPKRQEKVQDIITANQVYKKEITRLENIVRNQKKQLEVYVVLVRICIRNVFVMHSVFSNLV